MNVLLKRILQQRQLSMGEAAKEIGLSRRTLQRWSRGDSVDMASREQIEAWLATNNPAPYDQELISSIDKLLASLSLPQDKRNVILALIEVFRQ